MIPTEVDLTTDVGGVQPGGVIPVSQFRGTSDGVMLAPRLTSPIALDAMKSEPEYG